MAKIRNLKGGIFRRPVDTPAGKAGWCADISYEEFTPRKNNKGNKDCRQAMNVNWTPRAKHYGPCKTESEVRAQYEPDYKKLADLANKPAEQK